MKKRITDLDDHDGNWNNANPDSPLADGIHWDQIGQGTNWEDGLWNVFRRTDGTYYGLDQPDLVVFVTDGEPTMIRTRRRWLCHRLQPGCDRRCGGHRRHRPVAGRSSDRRHGRQQLQQLDVRELSEGRRRRTVEWNGSVAGNGTITVGNAATADLFKGSFTQLGADPALDHDRRMRWHAHRAEAHPERLPLSTTRPPVPGRIRRRSGERVLDRAKTSSITFDYVFANGEVNKVVADRGAASRRLRLGPCRVHGERRRRPLYAKR